MTSLSITIIYLILIAVTTLTLMFAWVRDRHKPITKHLIRLCVISLFWQICSALFFVVKSEALALWLHDAKLVFVAFAPVQLLVLGFRFYDTGTSRSRKLLFGLLCIIPAITAVLGLTSPFHHLIRAELYFLRHEPLRMLQNVRGPWFWVHSAYSYILMVSVIIVILTRHSKLPKGFRLPSTLVVIGSAIAILSNALVVFTPYFQVVDLTLVGLVAALVVTYLGITISDDSNILALALDNIFNFLEDYIFILDNNRSIIQMNPAARRWLQILHIGEDTVVFNDLVEKLLSNKGSLYRDETGEQDFQLMVNQQVSNYNLKERPITDQSGRQIGVFAVFTDVTRYRLLIRHLEQTAGVDPLTALGNRLSYEQGLTEIDVPASLPISVILGDVNGLKYVNDSMGHATGDAMLRTIARVLRETCPKDAQAYRIGGDEFVLLMPRTSQAGAEVIAEAIRTSLAKYSYGPSFRASIALGIATKETGEQDLGECIAQADSGMYLNKQNDRRQRPE